MVKARRSKRIVDAVLLGLIVIAAAWLGRLVYHNYFGGHVALESEREIVSLLQEARERQPDASRSEVDWPENRPALSYLNVGAERIIRYRLVEPWENGE